MKSITRKAIMAAGSAGIALAPIAASADTTNTVINAVISASISTFTTSTPITINLAPGASPDQACASDTVTVSTNAANGYSLTLKDSDTTYTLTKGADTIAKSANTYAAPAVLATNTWGWREDGLGNFTAAATTATGSGCTGALFAEIPANASPVTLSARGTGPYSNNTHTLWYSAKADSTKPNGTYTDTVTYTATTL